MGAVCYRLPFEEKGRLRLNPGARVDSQEGEWQEESSFCEQKEAKKLCPLAAGCPDGRLQVIKVFLLLFFQKKKTLAFLPDAAA
jgi:hypothetical protein